MALWRRNGSYVDHSLVATQGAVRMRRSVNRSRRK